MTEKNKTYRPTFKKLTKYLEEVIKNNEDYINLLEDKNGYLAGEAMGCRNMAKDILNYIKVGKFNIDLDFIKASKEGDWLNEEKIISKMNNASY